MQQWFINKKLLTCNQHLIQSFYQVCIKTKEQTEIKNCSEEIGDVSAATLSRIEQGKIPRCDTFIKICKWLDVTTDTFILDNTKK